jgi:hypothetical protein
MMGGSVPTDSLVEILEAPFVIMPLVNGDTHTRRAARRTNPRQKRKTVLHEKGIRNPAASSQKRRAIDAQSAAPEKDRSQNKANKI